MSEKACTICGKIYPATSDYFYVSSYKTHRLRAQCKHCLLEINKKYSQTPAGRESKRRSDSKQHKAKKYLAAYKNQKFNHPDHFRARTSLNYSIRTKKLPPAKELKCLRCGDQADQYHHFLGYEKHHWRDVIPLCLDCHRLIDRIIKERNNA